MKYEVYKQDNNKLDTEKVTRFHTTKKLVAFTFMDEKNKLEGRNIWRVAMCLTKYVCFDIDIPSEKNIKEVTAYYTALFGYNFRIIRTNAGYHLISKKKYTNKAEWLLDECRILNPFVESCNVPDYIQRVKEFYREQSKTKMKEGITKDKFLDELSNEFRKSGLFFGVGIFDILFSINVLFRGYHCIRISKKSKDDNPEEIFTFP